MPLGRILQRLIQPHLVQKLSESKPIKRAAQITVALMNRGKDLGQSTFEETSLKSSEKRQHAENELEDAANTMQRVLKRFRENMDEELNSREQKKK